MSGCFSLGCDSFLTPTLSFHHFFPTTQKEKNLPLKPTASLPLKIGPKRPQKEAVWKLVFPTMEPITSDFPIERCVHYTHWLIGILIYNASHSAVLDPEKKSLNGLFSLLNM